MANSSNTIHRSYEKYVRNVGILIIKMLLLLSLTVGSTLAIFTTRHEDTINISAAQMGMKLYRADETIVDESGFIEITGAEGDAFKGIEWEPGATRLMIFKVENGGDIRVKYVLRFVADMGELYGAFEYISFGFNGDYSELAEIKAEGWDGLKSKYTPKLLDNNSEDLHYSNELKKMETENRISGEKPQFLDVSGTAYFIVALHMRRSAGNEFQKKSCEIVVKLYAEQGNL